MQIGGEFNAQVGANDELDSIDCKNVGRHACGTQKIRGQWLRYWADWSGPGIASLLPNLDGREDHRVRGWLWHNWLASWKNPHILVFTRIASWSHQSSSQIGLEHFSNVGAGLSLDSNLQVNLFLIWDSRDGGDGCEKGAKNEKT